jgi:hypothetical protein
MTITLAAWAALSLPAALLAARCIEPPARLRRHKRAVADTADEVVNWIAVLPPVPIAHDLQWLLDQPLQIRLTDTEVGIRLRDIEAAEGWVR